MIVLIGIRKKIPLHIREKLSINESMQEEFLGKLKNKFDEAVIINTCNRTEIYIDTDKFSDCDIDSVFNILNWNLEFKKYCFVFYDKEAVKHLFLVACGFHSRITGEDQILGQVKDALKISDEYNAAGHTLSRLFQQVIACGKKFRTNSKLYEIPVSSASIVANICAKKNISKMIILGYGDVGQKVYKYVKDSNIEEIIIVVRDITKKREGICDRTSLMTYEMVKEYLNSTNVIVSCTSSNNIVISENDIDINGEKLEIFDLAVPRDVHQVVGEYKRVNLLNIDDVSRLDDENRILRKRRMYEHRHIVDEAISDFMDWLDLREISTDISKIREFSNHVVEERCETFSRKSKSTNKADIKLASLMIKSTANVYANRAIEVLKEEKLKGNEDECLRILNMIFS